MELRKQNEQSVKREEFRFLCSFLLNEMEIVDDNIFVEMQHQIDPWKARLLILKTHYKPNSLLKIEPKPKLKFNPI